ncbi:MAG: YihY/virulence factor BrkB family protein, partial [Acidimicrobiales bacterium]
MRRLHKALDALNAYQRRKPFLAVAVAVNKKYSEDNGSNLSALTAYHGLLSVFPLLLAVFTIASYVVGNDSSAIHSLQQHLKEVPVIGQYLTAGHLKGNAFALVVGLVGLLWGALGLSKTLQFAMAEVWDVDEIDRPGFRSRLVKGLTWYAC